MSKWIFYNVEDREIHDVIEFPSYFEAENYLKENLSKDYQRAVVDHMLHHKLNDLYNDFEHPDFLRNKYNKVVVIKEESGDQKTIYHQGGISMNELDSLRDIGCEVKWISHIEFAKKAIEKIKSFEDIDNVIYLKN